MVQAVSVSQLVVLVYKKTCILGFKIEGSAVWGFKPSRDEIVCKIKTQETVALPSSVVKNLYFNSWPLKIKFWWIRDLPQALLLALLSGCCVELPGLANKYVIRSGGETWMAHEFFGDPKGKDEKKWFCPMNIMSSSDTEHIVMMILSSAMEYYKWKKSVNADRFINRGL